MKFYVSDRVAAGTDYSEWAGKTYEVQQGTCLGPILYTMSTCQLFKKYLKDWM